MTPDLRGTTADTATAVWLCRDTGTGEVLAWASAGYTYDGTRGLFSKLGVVVTAAGAAHEHPVPPGTGGPR